MHTKTTALATSAMVFLGAFLSFSMEPMVGRMITPYFGGAVHLWTISLMVFQALLLSGYVYAHWIAPRMGGWHLLLLALPLLQWPLNFTSEYAPKAPTLTLIKQLLLQVSLPFAVLCTTAVVAQNWWYQASQANAGSKREPFFLYAISNWGAMVALFAYPFAIEPWMGLNTQRWTWSFAYLVYCATAIWAWFALRPKRVQVDSSVAHTVQTKVWVKWLLLAAAPSAFLLATTNVVAMEVGSFPMVWVIPLALYLGSFIVAFQGESKYTWQTQLAKYVPELAVLALVLSHLSSAALWALPALFVVFFLLCLIAHRALYMARPHPSRLSTFYLSISLGGWLGGLSVSLVAPRVFNGLQEYIWAAALIVLLCWPKGWASWWRHAPRLAGYTRLLVLCGGLSFLGVNEFNDQPTHAMRNFYGTYRIIDKPAQGDTAAHRTLVHGKTVHGIQYLNAEKAHEPLAYYFNGGALEQGMSVRKANGHSALIGLGAGNAIPWFDQQEALTIFEIDPDVETLARQWFSFLSKAQANTAVEIGDARLNLQKAQTTTLNNAMLIDAFSGDGVPVHLLTLEALDIYLSRLASDGVLVFHISNRYYDLLPVLKAAANARGLQALTNDVTAVETSRLKINPKVVIVSRTNERFTKLRELGWVDVNNSPTIPTIRPWTDDHVNVLGALAFKLHAQP